MNTHIVTRALPGPNGLIPVGTEIDAVDFKRVDLLVAQRYLKPLKSDIDSEESASFEERVIAVVLKHARDGGELASLLTPLPIIRKRGRRRGTKNKSKQNIPA